MLNDSSVRRDFVITVVGRMVSTFGDGVALIALTLRLQADGAHPYEIGLLLGAGTIPLLLLARPVGRLVDAHDSRMLLVVGGLLETAATIPLIFLHAVVPMILLVAVLGAAASVTSATWSALLPRVVGEERLASAISTQQALQALVLVGAPAVGGVLAGAFGAGIAITVDAVTFLIVTGAAALVRTRRAPEPAPESEDPVATRDGFAILRADRVLAPLLAGITVVLLLIGMVDVVLVYLVRETLHASGVWYGVTEASWMVGLVIGSVAAGRVKTGLGQERMTIAGAALACAGLAGFAIAPGVGVLVALSVIGGIGNGYAGTCMSTLLMSRTAEHERGRVSAATSALLNSAQGASLLLGGAVAVALSPRAVYAVAGLLGVSAAGVIALLSAARSGRDRSTVSAAPRPSPARPAP